MILWTIGVSCASCLVAACSAPQAAKGHKAEVVEPSLTTAVLTMQTAKSETEEWGKFVEYLSGEIEGDGIWAVGDETFETAKVDMLYAAMWDSHGIKNTGDTPLTLISWKWNSKGIPVPVDPDQ